MTELNSKVLDYSSLGILVGMPGIEPVYVDTEVDRSVDTRIELDMNLPY